MNTVKIGFALQFKTQIAPDGRQIMMVDTVDIIVDINRNDIKLHISGNWLSDIGSIFTIFFKGTVVDLINTAVYGALESTLPNVINASLLANNGYFHFIPNWWWDWESPSPAIVSTDDWCLPIKGLLLNNLIGEVIPDVAIPSMPCKVTSSASQLQGCASTWAIDSFF